jgi:hypothetical protein
MKASRFKVIILLLLAVTVIYAVALYKSVQEYEAWKRSEIERYCREHGGTQEFWEGLLDFLPYWQTKAAQEFAIAGLGLVLVWGILIVVKRKW